MIVWKWSVSSNRPVFIGHANVTKVQREGYRFYKICPIRLESHIKKNEIELTFNETNEIMLLKPRIHALCTKVYDLTRPNTSSIAVLLL